MFSLTFKHPVCYYTRMGYNNILGLFWLKLKAARILELDYTELMNLSIYWKILIRGYT